MTTSQPKTHRTKRVDVPEVDFTEQPGINAPQLEDRQVARRSPKVIAYTHAVGDGTGIKYFDGFGFRPRTLNISAWKDENNEFATTCDGIINEDGRGYIKRLSHTSGGTLLSSITDSGTSFILRDEALNIAGGEFVSYGSDGVNIDISVLDFDIVVIITAYE